MVHTEEAREDVDNELLTEAISYTHYEDVEADLAYDTIARDAGVTYSILAQISIQRIESKYVMMGRLKEGDMVGLLRYEYSTDADNVEISPAMVPRKGDELIYLERKFIIKECTPISSEDNSIIAFEITGGQIDN